MGQNGGPYLAECVEDVVEVDENLPLGYLGDVIHGLARIVPNPGILIGKAGQDRRNNNLQVLGKLLFKRRGVEKSETVQMQHLVESGQENLVM